MDRKTAILISMGFEIIGIVLVAVYVGGYLDEKYSWDGMGVVGAIAIGFAGWLTHLLVAVKDLDKAPGDKTPGEPK